MPRKPRKTKPDRDAVVRMIHEDEPLDVPEVAVAVRGSEWVVRELIRKGELPSFRLGRSIRVPAAAVKRLLELS